ncbi:MULTISPECIES: 2-hydroxychromene-2-carboxylate isomerase [Amycolatopsis]|uniref:2-hydroxychromene-2-carboxylate isomerase n=1 Tax=Amycolatopsis sp. cg13 TaxID=3238807 RepID=UPI003526AE49
MGTSTTPRFYFSLRSPYSWLAYRDLLAFHRDVADLIEWRPYYEPDERSARLIAEFGGELPYTDMSRAKHLYILQDVARLAAARGVRPSWPLDVEPVWEVPHLGYLYAERHGSGRAFVDAVYRARWEQGRDICDRRTIGEIGAALDLDSAAVANACDDDELRVAGARGMADAVEDGAFGVPFFVHRFTRFWGLDRLEEFAAHVRAKRPPRQRCTEVVTTAVGLGRSPDDGHAGGCG